MRNKIVNHLLTRPETLACSLEFNEVHLSILDSHAIANYCGREDCPPHASKFVSYAFLISQLRVPSGSLGLRVVGELAGAYFP